MLLGPPLPSYFSLCISSSLSLCHPRFPPHLSTLPPLVNEESAGSPQTERPPERFCLFFIFVVAHFFVCFDFLAASVDGQLGLSHVFVPTSDMNAWKSVYPHRPLPDIGHPDTYQTPPFVHTRPQTHISHQHGA